MEGRSQDKRLHSDVKPSFTALNVAQAYYLSPEYNNFRNRINHQLIHYLVASAKYVYPITSKWFAQLYDTLPISIGSFIHSVFNVKNYPGFIATRKEYISDSVDHAIEILSKAQDGEENIEQVLVIGGGFDVMALVKHKIYPHVHFFEVDRGPHREIKLQALEALSKNTYPSDEIRQLAKGLESFGSLNQNMHFVEVDLDIEGWESNLLSQGFDPKKNTICIAEGLTMYLTPQKVCAWLGVMKLLLTDKSILILSFIEDANHSTTEQIGQQLMAQTNESYKMRLSHSNVPKFLFDNGFTIIESLPYDEIQKSLGLKESEMSTAKNLKENYFKVERRKPESILEETFSRSVGNCIIKNKN